MNPEYHRLISFQQDTSRTSIRKDTVSRQDSVKQTGDTTLRKKPRALSLEAIDSILLRGEQRLKKIDSVNLRKKQLRRAAAKKEKPVAQTTLPDTTQLLARFRSFRGNDGPELLNRAGYPDFSRPADSMMVYRPVEKTKNFFPGENVHASQQPVILERKPAYLRENWFLGVLSLSFILIIWTKIRFGKLLNETVTGMWNYKNSFSLYRNRSSLYQQTSFLLFLNYLLSAGLFAYLSLKAFHALPFRQELSPFLQYLTIVSGLAGLYFYLVFVIRLTGFFSLSQETMSEYSHFTTLFFHNLGIYLFPLNALIPYIDKEIAPWLIYAGFFVISAFWLLRFVKLIILFIKERFFLFFMFLYLCALEILPVLIFIHLIFR